MLKRFFADTKKYFRYAVDAARAQLKAEVANSYLNWIWWILEPICFTAIYYLVFAVFFGLKEQYPIVFIVIGIAMWDCFSNTMKNSVNLMRSNKSIVSKVYLPKYVLIYVRIGVNGFKMLISFAIAVVLMIIYQVPVTWRLLYAIPILITYILFVYGMSCFLLHFGVFVADLKNIVDIALRMVFYLTGIFYNVEKRIPAPFGRLLTRFNPVAFMIDGMRKIMLYDKSPGWKVLSCWFAFSILLTFFGTLLIYKNENSYVKSI